MQELTPLIAALLERGYTVTFSRDRVGRLANVSGPGGYSYTAAADDPYEALCAAWPDDIDFPEGEHQGGDIDGHKVLHLLGKIIAVLCERGEWESVAAAVLADGQDDDVAAQDCKCGHAFPEHTEESPDVEGLSGRQMCARDDCGCLAYRSAL